MLDTNPAGRQKEARGGPGGGKVREGWWGWVSLGEAGKGRLLLPTLCPFPGPRARRHLLVLGIRDRPLFLNHLVVQY